MGMEKVDKKMEDTDTDTEMELELSEPVPTQIACPYCYEEFEVASLSVHLEEDHPYENQAEPCPICSHLITRHMLIRHVTMKHDGLFFKNGHRSRRYLISNSASHAISALTQDFKDFLGGRRHRSSNRAATNILSDPLLSSFGLGFATTTNAPKPSKLPSPSLCNETPTRLWESSIDSSLTSVEREQKGQQATERATFVQGMVLSTLFGD